MRLLKVNMDHWPDCHCWKSLCLYMQSQGNRQDRTCYSYCTGRWYLEI